MAELILNLFIFITTAGVVALSVFILLVAIDMVPFSKEVSNESEIQD